MVLGSGKADPPVVMQTKIPGGGGVLPYISHLGMCGPKGMIFDPLWYEIEDITCPRVDTNFTFECSTRYFTSERSERVRYRVEHEKIKFVSTRGHVIFCLLYKQQRQGYFSNFPNISEDFRRFLKILRTVSEVNPNISAHFPKIFEDVRRCPKIAEGCRIFPSNRRRCFDHIEMNLGSFDN